MYLVLTTSTGEAITVVHNPAPKADTKWQGRLSVERRLKVTPLKRKNTGAYHVVISHYPAASVLPVRCVDLRSASLIKSYVTNSVQLTIAFLAMFGAVPV